MMCQPEEGGNPNLRVVYVCNDGELVIVMEFSIKIT